MSDERDLEQLTHAVVRAVSDGLGAQDPAVMELVVREVVSVMSDAGRVPPASTPAPPRDSPRAQGAVDNLDGTITTPLGSVLPRPSGADSTLDLCVRCVELERRRSLNRAVVTTTGRNSKGVVASMSSQVAEAGGDIHDISQTIVADYFTMIMVVDINELQVPFAEFKERIVTAARTLGIHAVVMHEEVLRSLQRV